MDAKARDFQQKLLATFQAEAGESLRMLASGLLALEKAPLVGERLAIIESVYREAHNLKGAARAVNLTAIESLCQSLESVFAGLKRQEIKLSPGLFDTLHHALDAASHLLVAPDKGDTPSLVDLMRQLAGIEAREDHEDVAPTPMSLALGGDAVAPQSSPVATDPPPLAHTIRISAVKLEALFRQAEEILAAKLTARQRTVDLRDVKARLDLWRQAWAKIAPEVRKMQQFLDRKEGQADVRQIAAQCAKPLEFLEWHHTHCTMLDSQLNTLVVSAERDHRELSRMVDDLIEEAKQLLMLPFSSLLDLLPKLVRDLSRDQGKEVELRSQGGEVEIDRRVLEELKDPLIHLLRNCIDHGVEEPAARAGSHKSPQGTIRIRVAQPHGNQVEVCVADDGQGIDLARVKAAAVRRGIVSDMEADKLSRHDVLALIFQSDISTSPIVTNLSGRGLGLAIVREKVEKLGGSISVETESGRGTSFRMLLPVTLTTFRGVLVQAAEQVFVIPTVHVERVMRITPAAIASVENRQTVILPGGIVPLVRLVDVLELPQQSTPDDAAAFMPIVLVGTADRRLALRVDAVLHEQEVLVKNLGKQLVRVRNIAGSTVLGSGKVVPILHIADVIKSAVRGVGAVGAVGAPAGTAAATGEVVTQRKSILVAEDSLTSRMLLKNILESDGYHVKTAIDGADAFAVLKTEAFDLVLSYVGMLCLNGFDLTRKIRNDKQLSDLPVVLVTALASREDRERGIDAGANAYFVKSSFDQSNLLEVVRKLV